jgi:2-polyprenyl-6-methoxyphenol hydroxylase-like FAD-dependent oxidoreductase
VLFKYAASLSKLRILSRTSVCEFEQDETAVRAIAKDPDAGEDREIFASYLIGCDGAHSNVRHKIGARLNGDTAVLAAQSSYIHAPALLGMMASPAWAIDRINPRCCGLIFAIDGCERGSSTTSWSARKACRLLTAIAAFGRSWVSGTRSRSIFLVRKIGSGGA